MKKSKNFPQILQKFEILSIWKVAKKVAGRNPQKTVAISLQKQPNLWFIAKSGNLGTNKISPLSPSLHEKLEEGSF